MQLASSGSSLSGVDLQVRATETKMSRGCEYYSPESRRVSEAARLVESCCSAVVGIAVELESNLKLRLELHSDEVADLTLRAC